jgi:hypothetical protein
MLRRFRATFRFVLVSASMNRTRTARHLATSALATTLLLLSPAQALALPSIGRVVAQDATSPAVTDGHSLEAYVPAPGTIRVRRAGAGSFDVDVTNACPTPIRYVSAVGGGEVLFNCPGPPARPLLLDVATRTVQEPVGAAKAIADAENDPTGGYAGALDVGAYGLLLATPAYHAADAQEVLDWHTGATTSAYPPATAVLDLDSPTMSMPLCAPLTRKPYDTPLTFDTPPFDPYRYEAPYGVLDGPRTSLTLEQCGSTRTLVLQPWRRFHPRALQIELASGFVSWVLNDGQRASLYAYLPACHLRLQWAVRSWPSSVPSISAVRTGHVAHGVILSEASSAGWTIRRLLIGTVCDWAPRAVRLGLFSADRTVASVMPHDGSVPLDHVDALASIFGTRAPPIPLVRLRAGARLDASVGAAVRRAHWRVGAGSWHIARGKRWSASLTVPGIRVPQPLTIVLDFRAGGSARYLIRVAANAR